jgi:hypothetical protein
MSVGTGRVSLEKLDHMVVNREFLPALKRAGMTDFERVFHFDGGTLVKRIKARSVTRITIGGPMRPLDLYLKRHVGARAALSELLAAWMNPGRSITPGMVEFENICAFREHGLATVTPVAAGRRRIGLLRYESFLITESVSPFTSLEAIIRHDPARFEGPQGEVFKRSLLTAVGVLARRMHAAGFNNRDFNATHVLIGPDEGNDRIALALFDLQRVDRKKWMRFRWMIKTMAELIYSMPAPLFSDRDHRRLFSAYAGRAGQGCRDRFLWWWIKKKVGRIARHTENIRRRRETLKPEEREIRPF